MNKYIITILIALSGVCQCQEWYSKVDKAYVERQDKLFYKEYSKTHPEFIKHLILFKGYLVTGNADELYKFRSKLFMKTVNRRVFSKYLCDARELPTRVIYALEGSRIGENDATVKAYYIKGNDQFEICNETYDIWQRIDGKWFFVSNTLPWGSEVISPGGLK